MGSPTSVEAISGGATDESPPVWATITYQFPPRGKRGPVKLVWYDGKRDGKPNLPPAEVSDGENLGRFESARKSSGMRRT